MGKNGRHRKELECLQKKLLDVSFDKVIKFGVLYLEEEKGKRCKRRVLFVRQVDVFHFHGLPCFLVRVEYASHSISKSSFYIANIAEKVANSFK